VPIATRSMPLVAVGALAGGLVIFSALVLGRRLV